MRLSDLEAKEVINTCDCKKLGYISDLILDECEGCIKSVIVPKCSRFCGLFGDGDEYVIPFSCIERIGPDIILVKIHEKD